MLVIGRFFFGKRQITLLKFWSVLILYPKSSICRFYPLKFENIWILHPNISEFGFYPLNFRCVWMLLFKILG